MDELWSPVVGREGTYEVSNLGRVRSLDRILDTHKGSTGYQRLVRGRILRPGIASHGYPTVALGRGNTRTVHSLVAEVFHGPCPSGQEVRHRDGTRTNSRADNLHYGTRTENILDAVANGTWMSPARIAGWRRTRGRRWKS